MKPAKHFIPVIAILAVLAATVLSSLPQRTATTPALDANPLLANLEPMCVFVISPTADPNLPVSLSTQIKAAVERRLQQAAIPLFVPEPVVQYRPAPGPDLRVHIEALKLGDYDQYVIRIQTRLARTVRIFPTGSLSFKADVWQTNPLMTTTSPKDIPAGLTDLALQQVDDFIKNCKAAGRSAAGTTEPKLGPVAPPTQPQQPTVYQPTPVTYGYVASKNSKVFHKPDCRWAQRIKPENLVRYRTRQDAINAGRRPCQLCKP